MVDMNLTSSGTFYQSGVGFAYLTMVATSRYGDMAFGLRTYKAAQELLRRFNDPYTLGRGLTLLSLFVGHLFTPIRDSLEMQEEAVEYCLVSGDKHTFLFSVAGLALSRLYLGVDMAELESYCSIGPEDFGDWSRDLRGGVLLTAVRYVFMITFPIVHGCALQIGYTRLPKIGMPSGSIIFLNADFASCHSQVARALQGKTCTTSTDTVMSDEGHNTTAYMKYMHSNASNVEK